jgi:cytochrome P450
VSAFIPPYPPRLAEAPSALRRLMIGRRNFLAMWEESVFETDFAETRILMRPCFVCNSPDSVQFAFSLKNSSFERKSPQMRHALEPLLGDGLFVSDGDTWRARRRIVAPIVHIARLAAYAPHMVESATEFRDRWAQQDGTAIDVLSECAELTAEVLCRTLFGRQLGKHYARQIVDGFSQYQREIDQIDLMAMLGLPDWIPRYRNSALRTSVKRMHAVLDEIIASCRASAGQGEQSVIARLLDAKDEETGERLSHEAIGNEVAVIFMAGHETTANSLAWTWYLLSQAPDVEAKFHAELDTVLGGRLPGLDDVGNLAYTRAVFEEALRLYPPVPLLPREALQDETYRETKIPKGSLIFVVPWILHRHKHLWDRPDHFIPERFLGENAARISKFQYVPFSIGPRICAGMAFGLTEAILCLATIGQSLRLQLEPGTDVQPVCRLTLRPGDDLPMIVSRRFGADRSAAPPALPEAAAAANGGCPFHHA